MSEDPIQDLLIALANDLTSSPEDWVEIASTRLEPGGELSQAAIDALMSGNPSALRIVVNRNDGRLAATIGNQSVILP